MTDGVRRDDGCVCGWAADRVARSLPHPLPIG